MTEWQTLVHSLGERRPPSLDEVRDAHLLQRRREILAARHAGRAIQAHEQAAETERRILELASKRLVDVDDLHEAIRKTRHHLRQVAARMVEDGRLETKLGSYGKKYWRAI